MKRASVVLAIALSLAVAMTVQSATKPTGMIHVPAGMVLELKVNGKAAPLPSDKDVPINPGTYEPASLTCGAAAPGARGRTELWTIKCAGGANGWGKLKEITVQDGATTPIVAGPPFTLKTLVGKAENGPKGKTIPFTLRIYGKAGELYDLNSLRKGQSVPPELALQVVDEKGNVLATGTLPFG